MLDKFISWLVFDYPSNRANFRWTIKMIAVKLKLYKPDEYELKYIEHNKNIKKRKQEEYIL